MQLPLVISNTKHSRKTRNTESLVGNAYGRLTVTEMSHIDHRHSKVWLCQCMCGNLTKVTTSNLKRGNVSSCGCLSRDKLNRHGGRYISNFREDRKVAVFNQAYIQLRFRHARIKKRVSTDVGELISFEAFMVKSEQSCFYCGDTPKTELRDVQQLSILGSATVKTTILINGLDRVNPEKGYSDTNTVACCKVCNPAKLAMPRKDFLAWVKKVYMFNNLDEMAV